MNDLDILFDLIKKGKEGQNSGFKTGLDKLDKLVGGIQPSRYYLLTGSSSSGKTTLVVFFIYNMLKKMIPEKPLYLIYFSLEISQEVLLAKLLALYCAERFGIYLTINDIMSFNKPLTDYEYDCLNEAKQWLNKFNDNLIIFDKGLNSNILYRDTLELLNKNGKTEEVNGKTIYTPNNPEQLVLGIIDHIGLAFPTEGRNIKEEMDRISAFLVNLKRKYRMS